MLGFGSSGSCSRNACLFSRKHPMPTTIVMCRENESTDLDIGAGRLYILDSAYCVSGRIPMRGALIIATIVIGFASAARAEQAGAVPPDSPQGSNYPSPGSSRGPAFPKSVSPTGTNPTNWVTPPPQYTDPNAPDPRWTRWMRERWRY
jgi:hypothetical protein